MSNNLATLPPKVLVCVLNWNGRTHLEYSIPSVLQTSYSAYQILVVDNASSDDSVHFLNTSYPVVRVIVNQRNLGWAGGNNIGIRCALKEKFDWVLLLNNDVLVDPQCIGEAVRVGALSPWIGVIGFTVYGQACRVSKEEFYKAQRNYPGLYFTGASIVSGCAMLVRTTVFEHVGLIDETYILYAEEEDFQLRVKRAGYKIISINVPLWHHSEGTSRRIPYRTAYLAMRNRLRKGIKLEGYGVRETLRYLIGCLRVACVPYKDANADNSYLRRQRPSSNILVNIGLVAAAVGWNVVNWRATKAAGRSDLHRSEITRLQLESDDQ